MPPHREKTHSSTEPKLRPLTSPIITKKWKRIVRPATAQESVRHAKIRQKVLQEYPPLNTPRIPPAIDGIGAQIRAAREAQGLTRFALANKAGLASSKAVRDIEYGQDVKLSDVRTVAKTLGLELALVESVSQS
jgi:hypothetical protein